MTWQCKLAALFLSLLLLPGCNGDDPDPTAVTPTAETKPAAEPDDPAAVEALEAAATELKRYGDGFVKEVNFRGATIDDSVLEHLTGLKKLRYLLLNDTAITDDGLVAIGKIATLHNLDLRGCAVGNAGMGHLTGLTELRALRLSGKDGDTTVDNDGLVEIGKLKSLRVLMLDFLWLGDSEEGTTALAGLEHLEELYMANTFIDDAALAKIGQLTKLKKLRLAGLTIQNENDSLANLAKLSQLEELDLSDCASLLDDALVHLAGMKSLTKLNLYHLSSVTDDGIAHLAGLTNLKWLNLDNTMLSDEGIVHLQGMADLEFLHLGVTGGTDAGLKNLEPLTALKDLNVSRTGVTEVGAEQLQQTLPDVKIQLDYLGAQ